MDESASQTCFNSFIYLILAVVLHKCYIKKERIKKSRTKPKRYFLICSVLSLTLNLIPVTYSAFHNLHFTITTQSFLVLSDVEVKWGFNQTIPVIDNEKSLFHVNKA